MNEREERMGSTDDPSVLARQSTRTEWRISWLMWPFAWPRPHRTERVTDDEADARDQFEGLQSMLAPHEVRPCDEHVWDVRLEHRVVCDGEWEVVDV